MAVYFHGNFGLNRERMSGLLAYGLAHPELKDKDLAQPFGFGAPYAQRYRQWLYRTGLTTLGLPLALTPMGTTVYENDPKLESPTSQWFMHWELVTDPTRAEAWHFFWYTFLPQHEQFTKEELQMGLMEEFRKHSQEHFGPGSTMLPGITSKVLQCYLDNMGLGFLQLLQEHDGTYRKKAYTPEGPWRDSDEMKF
jgi:hypothetical protein